MYPADGYDIKNASAASVPLHQQAVENDDDDSHIDVDIQGEPEKEGSQARMLNDFPFQSLRLPPTTENEGKSNAVKGKGTMLRRRMGVKENQPQSVQDSAALMLYAEAKRHCGEDLTMPWSWYVENGKSATMITKVVDAMKAHGWGPRLARDVLMNVAHRFRQNAARKQNAALKAADETFKPRTGRPPKNREGTQKPIIQSIVENLKAIPDDEPLLWEASTKTVRKKAIPAADISEMKLVEPTKLKDSEAVTLIPLVDLVGSAKEHRANLMPINTYAAGKRNHNKSATSQIQTAAVSYQDFATLGSACQSSGAISPPDLQDVLEPGEPAYTATIKGFNVTLSRSLTWQSFYSKVVGVYQSVSEQKHYRFMHISYQNTMGREIIMEDEDDYALYVGRVSKCNVSRDSEYAVILIVRRDPSRLYPSDNSEEEEKQEGGVEKEKEEEAEDEAVEAVPITTGFPSPIEDNDHSAPPSRSSAAAEDNSVASDSRVAKGKAAVSIEKDSVLTSRKRKIKPSQKAREIADQFASQPIQRASRRKMASKAAMQARAFYIAED